MDIEEIQPSSSDIENTSPAPDTIIPSSAAYTPSPSKMATFAPSSEASRQGSKATSARSKDSRLPSARTGSVFDRLYKTQTAASSASKTWTPVRTEIRRNYVSPPSGGSRLSRGTPSPKHRMTRRSPTKSSPTLSMDESAKIFERLHITPTVANASKHGSPPKNALRSSPTKGNRSPSKNIPSTRTPLKLASKSPRVGYIYSPRMKPLTKLYFNSRYHPGIGREVVDPISLGSSFFQVFCEYESGGLTEAQIAREIIIAFFKKDFPSGRHWELHEPTVEERSGGGNSFNVKMCATYDWEDMFRIASAQGIVKCDPDAKEVSVFNYIYDVTSDL